MSELDTLLNTPFHTIIPGDLNSKHHSWSSRNVNSASLILSQYADSRNDIVITTPNYLIHYPNYPVQIAEILDLAIMKPRSLCYHIANLTTELSPNYTPKSHITRPVNKSRPDHTTSILQNYRLAKVQSHHESRDLPILHRLISCQN